MQALCHNASPRKPLATNDLYRLRGRCDNQELSHIPPPALPALGPSGDTTQGRNTGDTRSANGIRTSQGLGHKMTRELPPPLPRHVQLADQQTNGSPPLPPAGSRMSPKRTPADKFRRTSGADPSPARAVLPSRPVSKTGPGRAPPPAPFPSGRRDTGRPGVNPGRVGGVSLDELRPAPSNEEADEALPPP